MKQLTIFLIIFFSMYGFGSNKVHWSYSGEHGTNNWAKLSEDFEICATGRSQSPIDIKNTIESNLKDIKFNYESSGQTILNNGHTVQINFEEGSSIDIEGKSFNLKQYHFHSPSENHIRGKSFPLEVHMVHADDDGNLAVVSVLFDKGEENKELAKYWGQLPKYGEHFSINSVNAKDLLPKKDSYYRFSGSLTTPPCSEGVHWYVMEHQTSISNDQIKAFQAVLNGPNNRPVQPVNARIILED